MSLAVDEDDSLALFGTPPNVRTGPAANKIEPQKAPENSFQISPSQMGALREPEQTTVVRVGEETP